jgi:trigger factor
MQISVEATGKLERRMHVAVPAARVSQEIETRLKNLSRTARLNGFRPGKAPISVIKQQFGAQVEREVFGQLVQSSFSEAVEQQRLSLVGAPRIEPESIGAGRDLKYVATFEVLPEVNLAPIESIEIERTTAEVSAADIDSMVEKLRRQRVEYAAVARAARESDRVTVDFDGSVDGAPFPGGKGDNVAIVLGEGRMLPEFEQGLVAVSAGDQKELALTFPQNYPAAEIAGKSATFKVLVKRVEESSLPALNEEFFKFFGVEEGGVEKFRENVAESLRRELQAALRNKHKQVVMDALYQANPVDLPNALVQSQIEEMQVDVMRRTGAKDASQAPRRDLFEEPARRRAALGLVLGEIMQREKITLDRARLNERLAQATAGHPDPAALRAAYEKHPQALRQIEGLALEDQVVDWVMARAKVREVASTFQDVMKV